MRERGGGGGGERGERGGRERVRNGSFKLYNHVKLQA